MHGNVSGWFGTATDIDDLKRTEAALRASEEQFRRAIEDAPIPVIMQAEDGEVLQISRTWTELTGYGLDDVPTFDAWVHRAYGPGESEVRRLVRRLFSEDVKLLDTEVDITTAAGDRRRWSFSASAPGTLVDGRRFIVGMALDITERTRADEALRESQQLLRLIVENAREYAIFSLDRSRRITSWNAGAQAILGFSEAEVVGQKGDIIFVEEDRAVGVPAREAEKALTEGRASDERWHVRRDGTRFWASGVMTAMRDASGNAVGLLKIFRDQTAELLATEALERSRQRLAEALRETEQARAEAEAAGHAKDHFLAVLSHELRTPLTPILFATRMLEKHTDLPAAVRAALAMIGRNVELEAHFVDDLLDVTRIARGKMELTRAPIDVHDAVLRAVEVAGSDFETKGHAVEVKLEARRSEIDGDRARLQQVFWNLLKNAAKFTPPRGRVDIRSHNEGDTVVIEVQDTAWASIRR